MLRLNLFLAIGYFLSGYFGSLLSILPTHASPIWPAAGIALAGVYTYGTRAIPGIWIGAFCIQTYVFLNSAPPNNFTSSLVIGAATGTTATLQTLVATRLIKRYTVPHNALINDRSILGFLLLGGPVSCTISASFNLVFYYLHHLVSTDYIILSWVTWWIGDIIGVVIFTPLLLCFIGKPRNKWRTRIPTVALPQMALFLLVAILFQFTKEQEQARLRLLFNDHVNLLQNALQHKFDRHLEINRSFKALFSSSHEVTPTEFNIFTQDILNNHPSIQALEWIPKITKENYAHYQQLLGGAFPIHTMDGKAISFPQGYRGEHFPVAYFEPSTNNKSVFGLDLNSESSRNKALQLAKESMTTTATNSIHLVQDKENRPGILVFTPVYRPHQPLLTREQRHQYLLGFIGTAFWVENKINEVKSQFDHLPLQLKITDADGELFIDTINAPKSSLEMTGLEQTKILKVANRQWTVTYYATPQLDGDGPSWNIGWFILIGLLFTGITSSFLLMLTGRTLRTEDLVKIRTLELKKESNERQIIIRQHSDHNQILQAIASPAPLPDILNLIVSTTEKQFPASLCSILLLDEQEQHLTLGVAPSLPEFFIQTLEGMTVGEGICDFGTTAATGKRVIIENIEVHAYWRNFFGLAKQAGLAASWSEPILSSMNQILGVFTVYHRSPHYPEQSLLSEVCDLAQLASIAIERRSSEKQIIHLAYYDALTNLPNRRLFLDHLEKTLAGALRHHTHAALLYLDLDHFKTLNDSLGHDIGDELLIQVANRLKQCIRDEDTVARLGGDEFVLLLSGREISKESMFEHALSTAERVQSTLEVPYQLKEHIHHITPSIGITLMPQPGTTPGELLKQADTAMYHAKNRGRNSISFYSMDMQRRADQRLIMEKDLRAALSEKQFSLHYQPQFDNNHRLIGAEALIRWQHPEKGMISPAEFIPVAEETGLILAISEWVLQEACSQLKKWSSLPHLAVNISPKQFRQPKFEEQIAAGLTKHGIVSSRLMLEITEGSIIEDIEDSIIKLQSMQNLGINISIDDFGTGYSSLAYLKMLPLNQLKIDQSFVRDISIDNNDAVIVETIIAMSKHLGLTVIAEGVETPEQLQFLRDRKCKGYQGYFFSRPLPAHEFTRQFIDTFVTANIEK